MLLVTSIADMGGWVKDDCDPGIEPVLVGVGLMQYKYWRRDWQVLNNVSREDETSDNYREREEVWLVGGAKAYCFTIQLVSDSFH